MSNQGDTGPNWPYYAKAIQAIPKGASVLNLGSGHHFVFEKSLAKSNPEALIESVDLGSPEILPTHCKYQIGDIEDLDLARSFSAKSFDVITIFEVLEHIDKTDNCLQTASSLLKDNGVLLIAIPNLSSLFCRIELLLGFQPHVLEISNKIGPLGMGPFGKFNYGASTQPIHHIRGMTLRATVQLLALHGFRTVEKTGFLTKVPFFPKTRFVNLASSVLLVCEKVRSQQ
jgi:SAM-dependent methyltransferase